MQERSAEEKLITTLRFLCVIFSAFLLYNSARHTLFHRARHSAPSSLLSEMPDPERNPDDRSLH